MNRRELLKAIAAAPLAAAVPIAATPIWGPYVKREITMGYLGTPSAPTLKQAISLVEGLHEKNPGSIMMNPTAGLHVFEGRNSSGYVTSSVVYFERERIGV